MASLFTHAVVGAAIGQAGKPAWRKNWLYWVVVITCSILPDIDSIGFHLGVPYASLWGHRGMTHSLFFAFIVATLAAMAMQGRFHWQGRLVIVFFLAIVSHDLLDAMTNGGLGVAFFSPFNTQRYFFPWRPILVSPIGPGRFFGARGLKIIANEILWVWCPTLVLLAGIKLFQHWSQIPTGDTALSNNQD